MWLRDMLIPFLSQRYTMTANIPTVEAVQDVSCNIDSPSLNFETVALPSWMFNCFATDCASFGLALPVNTIRLSKAMRSL